MCAPYRAQTKGKVERFNAQVLTLLGTPAEREIITAGPFTAISEGRYLLWEPEDQSVRELNRQPPSRRRATTR